MKNKLLLIFAFWGVLGAVAVGQVFTCDSLKLTVDKDSVCLGNYIRLKVLSNNTLAADTLDYQWFEGSNQIGNDTNQLIYVPQATGAMTYSVKVFAPISMQKCELTLAESVEIKDKGTLPTLEEDNVTGNLLLPCHGDQGFITVTSQGLGYKYRIRETDAFEASFKFIHLLAGRYQVQIRNDTTGCESNTVFRKIEQPSELIVSAEIKKAIACKDSFGSIEVKHQGGTGLFRYKIQGNATDQADPVFTGLPTGTYTFVVTTDPGGCSATTLPVELVPAVSFDAEASGLIKCFGEKGIIKVTTDPGGSYKYRLLNGVQQDSAIFHNLLAGPHTFEVEEPISGCKVTTNTVLLTEPTPVTFSPASVPDSCTYNGISRGAINVTGASGGTPPYEYSLDGMTFQKQTMFGKLAPGPYTVFARDAKMCLAQSIKDTVGTNYVTLSLVSQSQVNVSCKGGSDGSFKVKAEKGAVMPAPAYSFTIGSGQPKTGNPGEEITFSGLSAQTYTITVKDMGGCTATVTVNITEPPPLTVTITPTQPTKCTEKGEADATPLGGSNGYQYKWSNGDTTQKTSNLAQGDYTVTVTDANGCKVMQSVYISAIGAPKLMATLTSPSKCNAPSGQANLTITDGKGPFTLSYTPPGGIPFSQKFSTSSISLTGLVVGDYVFAIIDSNECKATDPLNVPYFTNPPVSVDKTDPDCGQSTGSVEAFPLAMGNSYKWTGTFSGTKMGPTLSNLPAGTYTVTVTDQNGCTSTSSTTLTGTNLDQFLSTSPDVSICQGDNHTFSVTNTPLPTGWTYAWTPVAPASGTVGSAKDYTISPPTPGNYQYKLVVTDGSVTGTVCKGEKTVALQVKSRPMPLGSISPLQLCIYDSVLLDPKTTGANLKYHWMPDTSSKATFLAKSPNTYTVTVTNTTTDCAATATFVVEKKGKLPQPPAEKIIHKSPGNNNILLYPDSDPALCYLWGHIENGVEIPADPIQDKQHWFLGTGYMASRKYFVKIRLKENGTCDPCAYTQTERTILPDEEPSGFSALLLPNPNDGDFWLDIRLEQPEALEVQVLDLLGRQVTDHQEPASITDFRLPLHLANTLPPGLYQVRLSGADGRRLGLMPMVLTK